MNEEEEEEGGGGRREEKKIKKIKNCIASIKSLRGNSIR
jgi:hypothetical protein